VLLLICLNVCSACYCLLLLLLGGKIVYLAIRSGWDSLTRWIPYAVIVRGAWQSMVYRATHPDAVGAPLQRSCAPFNHRQQRSLVMRQQRLQQMYPVSSEPFLIAGVGGSAPGTSCRRIHPTRECTDAVVQLRAIVD
jgi:hypothetical protein